VVDDRTDNVRAVVAVPATAIVILGVVVQRKGLAALQRNGAIKAPTILQLLHTTTHIGQLVTEDPGEAVRNVEV
jgi:hypothetical protein